MITVQPGRARVLAVDVAILHDTARNLLPHLQQALAAVAAEEGESDA